MAKSNNKRPHRPVTLPHEFGIIPNVTALPSVIRISPLPIPEDVFALVNPFYAFMTLPSLMDVIGNKEIQLNTTAENNIFRSNMIATPGFYPNIVRPNVEEQIITSNSTSKVITDNTRERSQLQLALCAYIWILSYLLAYAPPEIRSEFVTRALVSGHVPTIFVEQFKRVRRSRCGSFQLFPTLVTNCSKIFITLYPQYKGTFLDTDVLFKTGGLQSLVECFTFMQAAPGNYIPFTKVEVGTLAPLDAGFTTRFNSVGVVCSLPALEYETRSSAVSVQTPPITLNYQRWLNQSIYLVTGHSYGSVIESVHVADAHIVQQVHSKNAAFLQFMKDPYYTSFELTSRALEVYSTTQSVATHIVYRVLGTIPNSYNPPSADPQADKVEMPRPKDKAQLEAPPKQAISLAKMFRDVNASQFVRLIKAFTVILNNKALTRKLYALAA